MPLLAPPAKIPSPAPLALPPRALAPAAAEPDPPGGAGSNLARRILDFTS